MKKTSSEETLKLVSEYKRSAKKRIKKLVEKETELEKIRKELEDKKYAKMQKSAKAGKKILEEARQIDFSQIENPLPVVVKKGKRICPYCQIKIPPEDEVKCPYCGAPITEG